MAHDTGKSVQIDKQLFLDLCRWHLGGLQDKELEEHIRAGLQRKLTAAAAREEYRKAKASPSP